MSWKGFKLTIELVPSTVWFSSLYQIYKKRNQLGEWKKIKDQLFEEEGRRCWICGKGGHLEAHEFWEYDDESHIQRLVAVHHLCGMCHKVKHIGFWCCTPDGNKLLAESGLTRDDLISHFCAVNNCSRRDFEKHEEEAFRIWRERSEYEWKQDFGKYGPNIIDTLSGSNEKRKDHRTQEHKHTILTEGLQRAPEYDYAIEVVPEGDGSDVVDLNTGEAFAVYNIGGEAWMKKIRDYSNAKPSEVTDVYWIYAERRKGKYPKPTPRSGKWLIFVDPEDVDEVWAKIKRAVEEGRLGDSAKVSTGKPNPHATSRQRVICVYTYDWTDEKDVKRIREELRKLGITSKIPYKADQDTIEGKYRKMGHSKISKYYE